MISVERKLKGDSFCYSALEYFCFDSGCVFFVPVSPSGEYFTISGIDKDSLHSMVDILDTSDWSTLASFRESCYSFSSSTEEGFFAEESSIENTCCYFKYDGTASWYVYSGLSAAFIIGKDRVCFQTCETDYETYQTKEAYLFCDLDGNILSEMSLPSIQEEDGGHCQLHALFTDLGVSDPEVSDTDISDTDISDTEVSDAENVTVCVSKDDAEYKANELSSAQTDSPEETESSETEDTPYIKTLVPDPDSYDWGDLAEANERANASVTVSIPKAGPIFCHGKAILAHNAVGPGKSIE